MMISIQNFTSWIVIQNNDLHGKRKRTSKAQKCANQSVKHLEKQRKGYGLPRDTNFFCKAIKILIEKNHTQYYALLTFIGSSAVVGKFLINCQSAMILFFVTY